MSNSKTVIKARAGLQDFELGTGKVSQTRNGVAVTIDRISTPFIVESVSQLQSFPVTNRYVSIDQNGSLKSYYYSSTSALAPNGDTVIQPNSAPGRWIKTELYGGGGSSIVDSTAITAIFEANDPADNITIELNFERSEEFCYCTAIVKGSDVRMGSAIFPDDAYNKVAVTAVNAQGSPLTVPTEYRPGADIYGKIPLTGLWISSIGVEHPVSSYLMVTPDGNITIYNIESGIVYIQGDADTSRAPMFAHASTYWRLGAS